MGDLNVVRPCEEPTKKKTSAVSHILNAVSQEMVSSYSEQLHDDGYSFIVATTPGLRRNSYELAYKVYHESGLLENESQLCITPYDQGDHVFTLLVQNDVGENIATATLLFDLDHGLPSDENYSNEINLMRDSGSKLVEVTRLAVDNAYRGEKRLLMRLFNFLYIQSYYIMNQTDLVIAVNPRHVFFYKNIFGFYEVGEEKPCPRVLGNPSVLLRGELEGGNKKIKEYHRNALIKTQGSNNFAKYFYGEREEQQIVKFMRDKCSAWSIAEMGAYQDILNGMDLYLASQENSIN